MKGVIDRFEGKYAVVEMDGGKMVNISMSEIESCAKEGDVIKKVKGSFIVDREETKKRKSKILKDTKDLWT
ncbi:MAG: DUF3006 domain-containing protein [Clostridiales bacterium]|nr:DUF3006 domain-containing protein [Clostridiales bacterium]HBM81840.1 DUF3006 domain-containing protein [Clostridiaceae bacterium]